MVDERNYMNLDDIRQFYAEEIRAVSNTVERRNRAAWRLEDAIASLAQATERILAPA